MKKRKYGKLLTVSLSENHYEAVRALSEQQDVSMGEVVRGMIQDSLANHCISSAGNEEQGFIDFNDYKELGDDEAFMGTEV